MAVNTIDKLQFLPRDAMLSAVYAVVVCLCVCVCVCVSVSVCLSHSDIVSKRLNVGSLKQRRTISPWLYFSDAKDHGEIQTGSPPRGGGQMQVEWVKIGHFRRKKRAITRKRYR